MKFLLVIAALLMSLSGLKESGAGKGSGGTEPFADRDALLRALYASHDSYSGMIYTEEQLKEMEREEGRQDYAAVLKRFVKDTLHQDIASFQTVSQSVNPRNVLVIAADGKAAYLVYMSRNYAHGGIWVVEGFKDYFDNGYTGMSGNYRLLKVEQTNGVVRQWADTLMKSPDWKKEYMKANGKTYAMIKSSSAKTDSVELQELSLSFGEVAVLYQTFEYDSASDPRINDYVLIELGTDTPIDVQFVLGYTNLPRGVPAERNPGDPSIMAPLEQKLVLGPKFLELAASGKIRGIEFGIGSGKEDVVAKWGKPDESGSRQTAYDQWRGYQYYFWQPDDKTGAIRVEGAPVRYTVDEIKTLLGKPDWEGESTDTTGWTLHYIAGKYELFFEAADKSGNVSGMLLK